MVIMNLWVLISDICNGDKLQVLISDFCSFDDETSGSVSDVCNGDNETLGCDIRHL